MSSIQMQRRYMNKQEAINEAWEVGMMSSCALKHNVDKALTI